MKLPKFQYRLPLNLQYFAGDDNPPNDPPADPPSDDVITLTPEELAKKLESESDKKTAKALETARKKWEAEYTAKLEAEKKEAERLAKLSATERKEAELEALRKQLETQQAEINKQQLKAQTITELTTKGLPASFADLLLGDTAEATLENINVFKTAFDAAIEQAVNERLKGSTPQTSGSAAEGMTKEQFNRLSYFDRVKLKNENPDLYNKLK